MSDAGISVLILAAGNSERMGQSKDTLPYGNGLTFAGQLISAYSQSGYGPIIMVVNERFNVNFTIEKMVQFVINHHVDRGRSWSIHLGLQHIPSGHSCFIQNIDNPFADAGLLLQMSAAIMPERYIVPVFNGKGGHPVLLGNKVVDQLRKKSSIPNLREALEENERFEVVSPDDRILLNINTPEAYHNFCKQVPLSFD